jgi:plasmid stability protein
VESFSVKTTLDLPADLVREMKLRAAHEGRKLRDVATEIFRRGLAQSGPQAGGAAHRVKLPLIVCPTASGDLTAERVSELLTRQEAEWTHETAGR